MKNVKKKYFLSNIIINKTNLKQNFFLYYNIYLNYFLKKYIFLKLFFEII